MTGEPTAGLLRRAATRLDELAEDATPGPWRAHDTWLDNGGYTAAVLAGDWHRVNLVAWLPSWSNEPLREDSAQWRSARWIAALSPVVAAPLAALLRAVADDAEAVDRQNTAARERAARRGDGGQTYIVHRPEVGRAVALARALLGETPAPEETP